MKVHTKLVGGLAALPIVFSALLLIIAIVIFISCIYLAAYLLPYIGLLLIAIGIISLDITFVIFGLVIGGFGGAVYMEWLENDLDRLPKVTEVINKYVRR